MHGIVIRSEVSSELLRRYISVKGDNRSNRNKFLEYIQHLGLNVQLYCLGPLVLIAPKTLNYLAFHSSDFDPA